MACKALPRLGATVLPLVVLAACSDSTGLSSDGSAEVTVTLQRSVLPAANLVVAADDTPVSAPQARVPISIVASLRVTITDVQLLRRCDDGEVGGEEGEGEQDQDCDGLGGWHAVTLNEPVTVDLVALPAEDESPVTIVSGQLPVGDYHNIRLFVRDETVVFAEPFSIGNSLFDSDTDYPVEIPSGDNTGIKTDLTLSVTDDGEGNGAEVNLLFDPEATFRSVVATGSGRVKLPPVFRVRPPLSE